ncbi:MAG: hypothetical protein ACFB15_06185 [Cyclobacteriaceae bacterium]
MQEPKFRSETREAIDSVAQKLNLPIEDWMQDWAYIVANEDQLKSYIDLYDRTVDDDEKFVLMQLIIQAADLRKQENQLSDADWQIIKQRLKTDFSIHEYTIFYWSQPEEDIEFCFRITPEIRSVWEVE